MSGNIYTFNADREMGQIWSMYPGTNSWLSYVDLDNPKHADRIQELFTHESVTKMRKDGTWSLCTKTHSQMSVVVIRDRLISKFVPELEKDAYFSFMHECGHGLMIPEVSKIAMREEKKWDSLKSGSEREKALTELNAEGTMQETAADCFAAMHCLRSGILTIEDIEKIAEARAYATWKV
jgi:hypothetical protein